MKITIEFQNNKKKIEANSIKEIVKKLNINLEEFLIIRNNELVSEDSKLKDKDSIKFLPVISGG